MRRIDPRRGAGPPRAHDEPAAAHERFKRLLGSRRREAASAPGTATGGERMGPLPSTVRADTQQQVPKPETLTAPHDEPQGDEHSDAEGRDEPEGEKADEADGRHGRTAPRDGSPVETAAARIDPPPTEALGATGLAAPWPHWLSETLRLVGWLGSHAEVLQHCWSATVPLNALLARCELQIDLSPHQLRLRFRAGSAESASLLCRHVAPLRVQLATLRGLPHDIDIDVE